MISISTPSELEASNFTEIESSGKKNQKRSRIDSDQNYFRAH